MNRRGFMGALGVTGALGIVAGTGTPALAAPAVRPGRPDGPFTLLEATVADIHAAFRRREITCRELVRLYLDRIEAYDRRGPELRAMLTLAPDALDVADDLDRRYRRTGPVGPLHGIPLVLKDNFDTADLPTTSGNTAMRDSVPPQDAFTVRRLRDAGAVVIAKSNLSEFARTGNSASSLGGQTLNPYDLTRTPGGSSGGTGTAIAANLGVLGTGSDTGQSIRSPASACSLVGVRPTRGLISRGGIMPNSLTQDEIGPITRTVADAARMLDVMAGFDPDDPITGFGVGRTPNSYLGGLRADALRGARIGVMTDMFGTEERHREVNRVMDEVAAVMRAEGATLVRFSLPGYAELQGEVANALWEARTAMDRYFATLGPDAPVRSFEELVATESAIPEVQSELEKELAIEDGLEQPAYKDATLSRDRLRLAVISTMAELRLDAILYPLQKVLVAPVGEGQPERNGVLSHGTGFPAICFPGGFSAPSKDAPLGVPVGAELLGRDYSEPLLLSLAYGFERAASVRRPPRSTPALG